MDAEDQITMRKGDWGKQALGYFFGVSVFVGLAILLGIDWQRFFEGVRSVPLLNLAAALICFALHTIINAVAFSFLQRQIADISSLKVYSRIWLISLLGKYLPGGVWAYASRAILLKNEGVPIRSSVVAMTVEQLFSLLIVIFIFFLAWVILNYHVELWKIIVLFAAASAFLTAILGSINVRISDAIWALILYAASMFPFYLGYYLVFPHTNWLELTYALFASTASGMLTFFVPGGVGVRESGLVVLLPSLEPSYAAASAFLARLLIALSELMLAILAFQAGSRRFFHNG